MTDVSSELAAIRLAVGQAKQYAPELNTGPVDSEKASVELVRAVASLSTVVEALERAVKKLERERGT
jgi:hypothetical protein